MVDTAEMLGYLISPNRYTAIIHCGVLKVKKKIHAKVG